ncbi:outer membrane lipoprotein carrier protein LolA [Spirochaetota bacterium]
MNLIIKIFITSTVILYSLPVFSLTGEEALSKFRGKMYGIGKLTGIISWTYNSGQTYSGSFKYLSPGKIFIKFSTPRGKILVSNGKKLWVYNPSSNICGIQELSRGSSGGIAGMTKGYFAILSSQSSSGYTIKLKSNDKRYNEIVLVLDRSFFLKKAVFKTGKGGGVSFTISNVDRKASVMKSLFNFNVPSSAQVVNNPLNIR